MSISVQQATAIVKKALPGGNMQAVVTYRNLYLFQVFNDRPGEEEWDPFYSVNQETGEFKDFSVITDGDISEIASLFNGAT